VNGQAKDTLEHVSRDGFETRERLELGYKKGSSLKSTG